MTSHRFPRLFVVVAFAAVAISTAQSGASLGTRPRVMRSERGRVAITVAGTASIAVSVVQASGTPPVAALAPRPSIVVPVAAIAVVPSPPPAPPLCHGGHWTSARPPPSSLVG